MAVTENVPSETNQRNRLVGEEASQAGYSDFASLRLRLAVLINSSDGENRAVSGVTTSEDNVQKGITATENDTTPLHMYTLPTEETARPTYQREYMNLPSLCPFTLDETIDLKGVTATENTTRELNWHVSETTTAEEHFSSFLSSLHEITVTENAPNDSSQANRLVDKETTSHAGCVGFSGLLLRSRPTISIESSDGDIVTTSDVTKDENTHEGVTAAENAQTNSGRYPDFSLRSRLAVLDRSSVENSISLANVAMDKNPAHETAVTENIAPENEINLRESEC